MARHRIARHLGPATLLISCVGLFACSEPTSPLANLKGNTRQSSSRVDTVAASAPVAPAATTMNMLWFSPTAPRLATYDATCPVQTGHANLCKVFDVSGQTPFLVISIPNDAQFFDSTGVQVKPNTVIPVRIQIDSVTALVRFSPHGTLFQGKTDAVLKLNYGFLNVGATPPTTLTLWYRPTVGVDWTSLPTTVTVGDRFLRIRLDHWSDYAIAY